MKRDLRFEAVYPNRLEEVWHALTDSGSLADWLMENDFKPLPGHKFHFRSKSRFGIERLIPCEVLVVDEPPAAVLVRLRRECRSGLPGFE